MQFEEKVSREAFKKFNIISHKRVQAQKSFKSLLTVVNIAHWIIFGVAIAALNSFYNACDVCDLKNLNISIIFLIVWIVAGFIIQKWYFLQYIKHGVSDSGTVLGMMNFKLDESGITENGTNFSSFYSWDSIDSIEKHDDLLLVFTDIAKAVIIPIGSLSEQQMQELQDILIKHTLFEP